MEFSQELISIAVIVLVCVILSICCICIWMCRCRQDQVRANEEKNDRATQLQNFEEGQAKNGVVQASIKPGNRLNIKDISKSTDTVRSHREESSRSHETIGQYEERITGVSNASNNNSRSGAATGIAQRFRDEEAAKNKRLDTISEIAMSNDSLQRNDSKTNVFNNIDGSRKTISPMEVDLNPGLSSSINLEKI
ncbi:uncharacterized protein CELE_F13H10.9 [Caenorhabditis elegans]|uniref:Uncharacterized protein n=1 Tax=Caenorhabditis elegans TaxID=6239 RepID=A0FLR4_CAEEL|nr:Uncharacterized protein CELE_F13H10.9 [Caenorhabditis elegans]CAL63997.1 Uncharacterized protein CELE_F13H10.9 [Caenorhabditis elegans]|eukprot:NP_001076683.1 Uncharacterized protein CELE_F13H10.9 [Caenorhabditis elegans]